MGKHSLIGPSAAHRWMNCPGSVQLIKDSGLGGETSPYADEGTRAHALAEKYLLEGSLVIPASGCDDAEMRKGVELFLREVWKAAKAPGEDADMITEQNFTLEHLHPDCSGTFDAAVYQRKKRKLHLFDFKFGAGVPVEVEGNEQLLYYLLGAARIYMQRRAQIDSFEITIVQPRFDHPDGPVRSQEVSWLDLLDFEGELLAGIARVEKLTDQLNPGKWCKFCPAKQACPALHSKALAVAATEFEVIPAGDVKKLVMDLSPDELAKRLQFMTWLKLYAGALYAHALAEAGHGRLPPGFKIVDKRARRKWKDEFAARGTIVAHYGSTNTLKLQTPAQVEKLIGKKQFKDFAYLAEAKSSGVKLVPSASKGTALTALDFEPLDDEEDEDNE